MMIGDISESNSEVISSQENGDDSGWNEVQNGRAKLLKILLLFHIHNSVLLYIYIQRIIRLK